MAGPRKADPIDIQMAPGVLTARTGRNAKGRWIDADNVRWHDGLPQKMGGYEEAELVDLDEEPQHYIGRARSCHEWDSLDGQNWIAVGTHCKLYLINNDQLYDITPIRRASTITNGLTTVEGSPVVTVSDPGHDGSEGSHVHFSGASEVGGITLDGEYEIESVIDLDTYTVRHSTPASSSDTGGGAITAQYELNCGLESDGTLDGYGTGDYGEDYYGTPRTASTFGGYARVWALDNFGEDLLASPNGESLYWWDRTNGPDARAVLVDDAPANIEYMLVGPDNRHVLLFGTNLASTGEQDRMFLRWCEGDNFRSWLATATNDAGSKRLDIGSRLITAVKTRSQIVTWSDKQLYTVAFVGGSKVYDVLAVGAAEPPVSKKAGIDVDGVTYWMAADDFYVYDGVIQRLPCEIREYVFGTKEERILNLPMASKVHCRYVPQFDEIQWHFPSIYADENDRVAIYNRREKCWYMSSMARECGLGKNAYYRVPVSFWDERMFLDETGNDVDDEEALVAYLSTFEGEIAMGARDMEVRTLIPDFKVLEGSVSVRLFGRNRPQEEFVYSRFATVDADTTEVGLPFKKKRVGLYIESADMGDNWRMDNWQHVTVPHGGR